MRIVLSTINHLFAMNIFQVLLGITNNKVRHQSFVYTHLNDQTVLLQIVNLTQAIFFCTVFKCQTSI